jgi:hypothetical protein
MLFHGRLPHDKDDSSEDGSMLEGNGESIFVSTSVDQDLQCTEAYVVDDKIDPDDENVVDLPLELPSFLYECSTSACTYLVCKDIYIWLYCAEWCWKLPHSEEPTGSSL